MLSREAAFHYMSATEEKRQRDALMKASYTFACLYSKLVGRFCDDPNAGPKPYPVGSHLAGLMNGWRAHDDKRWLPKQPKETLSRRGKFQYKRWQKRMAQLVHEMSCGLYELDDLIKQVRQAGGDRTPVDEAAKVCLSLYAAAAASYDGKPLASPPSGKAFRSRLKWFCACRDALGVGKLAKTIESGVPIEDVFASAPEALLEAWGRDQWPAGLWDGWPFVAPTARPISRRQLDAMARTARKALH